MAQLLNVAGYSLQGNRKTLEGTAHPDRNAQFEHINAKVKRFQQRGQPAISVDNFHGEWNYTVLPVRKKT